MTARDSRASLGLGVSGTSPRTPPAMRSRTACGYAVGRRRRRSARRMSTASRNVVASGTVGPDPMTLGSSPTTSEIANVRHAPGAAAASHPPLIADRCLRTVLSSWMFAPARSRWRVVACLSASVSPVGRHGHQRGRAARQQHEQRFVRLQRAGYFERAPPGPFALGGRHRVTADDELERNVSRTGAGRPDRRGRRESGGRIDRTRRAPSAPPPCPPR